MYSKRHFGKVLTILATSLLLVSCGGGGGGGGAGPTTPFTIVITVDDPALVTNEGEVAYEPGSDFSSGVTVTVTRNDGQAVTPTSVALSVSNATLGALSTVDDPSTQSSSLNLTTVSGIVSAIFHTRDQTGSVNVVASAFDSSANTNVTAQVRFDIGQGPEPQQRITITSNRTSIPANTFGVPIFYPNSPYVATLGLEFRNGDGVLTSPEGGEFGIGITPINIAAFTTPDDPETLDVNELFVLLANGPVDVAGGTASVFIHSFPFGEPGIATLNVTAQDPDTGEVFDAQFEIEIVQPASDGLPANVVMTVAEGPQYIQGSGGITARPIGVTVVDGAGVPVPDIQGNRNNVHIEVFSENPASGELLRGVNNAGAQVEGRSIGISTTAGETTATLLSGTAPGQVRVVATVDITDNNVSNGIDAPLRAESSVVIGDGIPFSVTLTGLAVNTLTVNPVDPNAVVPDPDPTDGIPPDPNGSYSLRVGALVTDRFGNPPAQPVELQFGLIDSPLDDYPTGGPGLFSMSGFDGNPAEGGTSFFAPISGEFLTGGGGAGPDDTLILFGKDVQGNDDLESARTVSLVNSQTNLRVDEPFNFNDFTGASVDNGPVIPYIVGRALVGNIETGAVTDSNGAAGTFINYPASNIGRSAAIYVQGTNGPLQGVGQIATYADAGLIRYPGLEPLTVTASPGIIPPNIAVNVLVCVEDAARSPITGQFVLFSFNAGEGVGTVDGVSGSGTVANPTGTDGCTVALVSTTGIQPGNSDAEFVFEVAGATANVSVAEPGASILQAIPSVIVGNSTAFVLTLRYLDTNGAPVPDVGITGECTSGDGIVIITDPPGATDVNGETTATLSIDVDAFTCGGAPSGVPGLRDMPAMEECEFSTASGTPMVTVPVIGIERDLLNFSPNPCP